MLQAGSDSVVRVSAQSAGWARGRENAVRTLMGSDRVWDMNGLIAAAFDTRVHAADDTIAALVSEWEQVGATNPERALQLAGL